MERSPFFRAGDGVVDCDGDHISPVGFDCGAWKLAVDEEYVFFVAIWCYGTSSNREVVDSFTAYSKS